jgi:hypothetical protein
VCFESLKRVLCVCMRAQSQSQTCLFLNRNIMIYMRVRNKFLEARVCTGSVLGEQGYLTATTTLTVHVESKVTIGTSSKRQLDLYSKYAIYGMKACAKYESLKVATYLSWPCSGKFERHQ